MKATVTPRFFRTWSHETLFIFPPTSSHKLQSGYTKIHSRFHAKVIKSCSSDTITMSTGITRRMPIFYSPMFKEHRPPPGRKHAECPERLDACIKALNEDKDLINLIDWITPMSVQGDRLEKVLKAIRQVHRFPDYLDEVKMISDGGGGSLDSDTYIGPGSYEIALLAASTWMEAVDKALTGSSGGAWSLTRPPGHHATPASGMGFCLLSNAAIAAKYALSKPEINHVAILDFDVHHGNGTEASVKNEKDIRFVSSHQYPLYPGTGREGIIGTYKNVKNINLDAGTGLQVYQKRYEEEMLPFLLQSEHGMPDLVIVSAGFDALDVDPLAQLNFKPCDYRLFTQLLMNAIGSNTKVVFGLEGGYNLGDKGIGAAVRETINGFCFNGKTAIDIENETVAQI